MPEIYRASNVEEAVAIATQFKAEGKYNWFRGQVRDWPPYSSAFRAFMSQDEERKQLATQRIGMFLRWAQQTPELSGLLAHPDAIIAVAQHYGIPTHHIDFTTEPGVAGFFAADGPMTTPLEDACLFCVSTADLLDLWETMKEFRPERHLELVNIDVSNLWRLEAQHGCFLYCDYNWDVDYPMDRIMFPRGGYPSWPTKEDIYPSQKSALELVLDQYFDIEDKTFGGASLRRAFEDARNRGANVHLHHYEIPASGYHAEAVQTETISVLSSWDPKALAPWKRTENERFENTLGPSITLQVNPGVGPAQAAAAISYGVRQVLRTKTQIRQLAFAWLLRGLFVPDPLQPDDLTQALQAVWNGMRRLPYVDDEIASAFGTTAHLFLEGFSLNPAQALAAKVLGDCFQVEFAAKDGSSSRGYIKRESFRAALRSDLNDLASEQLLRSGDVKRILLGIFKPSLLLEFGKLREIFANDLIPTQVLTRKLVLFSPANLETFGLP